MNEDRRSHSPAEIFGRANFECPRDCILIRSGAGFSRRLVQGDKYLAIHRACNRHVSGANARFVRETYIKNFHIDTDSLRSSDY